MSLKVSLSCDVMYNICIPIFCENKYLLRVKMTKTQHSCDVMYNICIPIFGENK